MANKIEKQFLDTKNKGPVRLNKYLSEAGVCSRREADKLIAAGQVTVDGVRAETGMKVEPWQVVRIGKKQVSRQEEMIVLAVNKPRGIVCTEERRERDSIVRFLNYPVRITYVGRLDKDSEGLLLMTNNGDIINRMMRAANKHEKEYKVTVDKPVTDEFLKEMAGGVPILDTVTRPCQVEKLGKYKFKFKHECFSSEEEVRGIYYVPHNDEKLPKEKKNIIRYRSQYGMIVPYIEMSFPREAIKEVRIAPNASEDAAASIKNYLKANNPGTHVKQSELPIRF